MDGSSHEGTEGHVPDEVYEEVRKHFRDDELVKLTLPVVAMM